MTGGEVTGVSSSSARGDAYHSSSAKPKNSRQEDHKLKQRPQAKAYRPVKSRDIRSFIFVSNEPSLEHKAHESRISKNQELASPKRSVICSQQSPNIIGADKPYAKSTPTPNKDKKIFTPRRKVIKRTPGKPNVIIVEESPQKADNKSSTPSVTRHDKDIRQFLTSDANPSSIYIDLVRNLNSGPKEDILSKHTIQMRRKDYRRLTGVNFLNDKIIDEYLTLIKERNQQEELPRIYPFPCYVFPHLRNDFSHFEFIEEKIKADLTCMDI